MVPTSAAPNRARAKAERVAEERARVIHDEVARVLRLHRRRYTVNCRRFVGAILRAGRPLTAADACRFEPNLALSTVYRVASTLVGLGALRAIVTTEGVQRFELSEELAAHHHHLICTQCGIILDAVVPADVEAALELMAAAGARTAGFRPLTHRFDVEGICKDCATPGSAKAGRGRLLASENTNSGEETAPIVQVERDLGRS
jgi:Fur family transcriptional regulator, ferric uptake regulator